METHVVQPYKRELIVIMKSEAGIRVTKNKITSINEKNITPLQELLDKEHIGLEPLFGNSENKIIENAKSLQSKTSKPVPDLSVYYRVKAPDNKLEELSKQFRRLDSVEAAYIKPPAELAKRSQIKKPDENRLKINKILPCENVEPPQVTPDFSNRQKYLDASPSGIDARFAWMQKGGRGEGITVIDIEYDWRFTHENLKENQGGIVGGIPYEENIEHGTAVIGVIGGDGNGYGVTGICSEAKIYGYSTINSSGEFDLSTALYNSANMLHSGDVILIELHYPGPRTNFAPNEDQKGYIAMEWWPDAYQSIQYAVALGIIVVEAAGNGAEDLDDKLYDKGRENFPNWWKNPFNPNNLGSGAIMVGAGAPPEGTHNIDWGPDRSRLDFSNYGSRIDVQGWGREVTTTGYCDLQGGSNKDRWYTDTFAGTSSASPIIVGVICCIQGILKAKNMELLTPEEITKLLHITGSTQQDAINRPKTQRIGNRPNIKEIISRLIPH